MHLRSYTRELQESQLNPNVSAPSENQNGTALLPQKTGAEQDYMSTYNMTRDDYLRMTDVKVLPSTLLSSFEPHITPLLPLTPNAYSVTSTEIHVTNNIQWLDTSLPSGPHQEKSDIWTEVYRASHSESDGHSALSSLGRSAAFDCCMTE